MSATNMSPSLLALARMARPAIFASPGHSPSLPSAGWNGRPVDREAWVALQIGSFACAGHRAELQLAIDELALDARDAGRAVRAERRDRLVATGVEQRVNPARELRLGLLDLLPGGHRRVAYLRVLGPTLVGVTPDELADLAHLRRARDLMDREYAQPLDVPAMARAALMSPAHFSRKFRAAYGETPYSYLMTRRIERAKNLLRQGMSVTDTCFAVGLHVARLVQLALHRDRRRDAFAVPPRDHRDLEVVPPCVSKIATRPRRTPVAS